MKNQIKFILFAALSLSALGLYQNCAKISYADDEGNVSTDLIDGSPNGGSGGPATDTGVQVVEFPPSQKNKMTIAFEDLMTFTNSSLNTDIDYNDFVMTYSVREENVAGELRKIEITMVPQARYAGLEAQLILSLQGNISDKPGSLAKPAFHNSKGVTAKMDYYDEQDQLVSTEIIDVTKPIVVFKKTSEVFINQLANLEVETSGDPIRVQCQEKAKRKAKITVTGIESHPDNKARSEIDKARYPFYLFVESSRTLMGTVDLHPTHKTTDGYPLGIQVPGSFLHPANYVYIFTVYPYFVEYTKLLAGEKLEASVEEKARNWYKWVTPDWQHKLACSPAP